MNSMLLFLLALLFPIAVHAAEGLHQANADNLKVRSRPSLDGQVLGQLMAGQQVNVFAEQNGWSRTFFNGQEAWIASQYLKPQNTAAHSGKAAVTAPEARLRKGPGSSHSTLKWLNQGDSLAVIDSKEDWLHVVTASGQTGWVAAWLTGAQQDTDRPVQSRTSKPPGKTSRPKQTAKLPANHLQGVTVILDPGHGGEDPGAYIRNGIREKDLTLSTSLNLAGKLRKQGADVILTRTRDKTVSLQERVAFSGRHRADVFLSIHYNAYPVRSVSGVSTHYLTDLEDLALARSIQRELKDALPLASRGVMKDNYYVLREQQTLSVLLELGFMTNKQDLAHIQTEAYQDTAAEAVTRALIRHFSR